MASVQESGGGSGGNESADSSSESSDGMELSKLLSVCELINVTLNLLNFSLV
tara:strand:+ start:277 stop:432 length:156 start_codon:yes stop_codon:yes gene_type:complete